MGRIGFLEKIGLKVYEFHSVDKRFLNMRKSFDQVNKMVKDLPGGKPKRQK